MSLCIPCGPQILSQLFYPAPFRNKCVFTIYAEIQDSHQTIRKTNFWKKWHMTVYTLGAKKCIEITLSCKVSDINAVLCEDGRKKKKKDFCQKVADHSAYTLEKKILLKSPFPRFFIFKVKKNRGV